jgi:hypothetical protein
MCAPSRVLSVTMTPLGQKDVIGGSKHMLCDGSALKALLLRLWPPAGTRLGKPVGEAPAMLSHIQILR